MGLVRGRGTARPRAADRERIALSLELSVPLAIEQLRGEPAACREVMAAQYAALILAHGEALCALAAGSDAAYDALARGLAALAWQRGQVTWLGRTWAASREPQGSGP